MNYKKISKELYTLSPNSTDLNTYQDSVRIADIIEASLKLNYGHALNIAGGIVTAYGENRTNSDGTKCLAIRATKDISEKISTFWHFVKEKQSESESSK